MPRIRTLLTAALLGLATLAGPAHASCTVNLGDCAGDCTVNGGTCAPGTTCLVYAAGGCLTDPPLSS